MVKKMSDIWRAILVQPRAVTCTRHDGPIGVGDRALVRVSAETGRTVEYRCTSCDREARAEGRKARAGASQLPLGFVPSLDERLLDAVRAGLVDGVIELIGLGADPQAADADGRSASQIAAARGLKALSAMLAMVVRNPKATA